MAPKFRHPLNAGNRIPPHPISSRISNSSMSCPTTAIERSERSSRAPGVTVCGSDVGSVCIPGLPASFPVLLLIQILVPFLFLRLRAIASVPSRHARVFYFGNFDQIDLVLSVRVPLAFAIPHFSVIVSK